MARIIEFDKKRFDDLLAELSTKDIEMAMKGAFRMAANTIKKTAESYAKAGIKGWNSRMSQLIRVKVWKRKAGFSVTIRSSKGKGYYMNQQNLRSAGISVGARGRISAVDKAKIKGMSSQPRALPVLIWAEEGTEPRFKKGGSSTGRMTPVKFMARAEQTAVPQADRELRNYLMTTVTKRSLKYGCTARNNVA